MPTQRHSHLVVYFLVNLMHPFLHGFSANKWRWLVIAVVVLFIPAVILLGYERQKSGRMARTTFFASGASAKRNELSLRKQSRLVSWKISKKHTWNGNVFLLPSFCFGKICVSIKLQSLQIWPKAVRDSVRFRNET